MLHGSVDKHLLRCTLLKAKPWGYSKCNIPDQTHLQVSASGLESIGATVSLSSLIPCPSASCTVDLSEAIRLWPLAVNMVACHVAGLGLGWLTGKTLKVPASLAPQVMVMTAMGNVGKHRLHSLSHQLSM
jgi:hypothetical protein